MRIWIPLSLLACGVLLSEARAVAGGCGSDVAPVKSCNCPNVKVHVHHVPVKQHHWCGPPAPIGPVMSTEAFRRVSPPVERTRLRYEREVQQEVGELKESGEKECGAEFSKVLEFLRTTREVAQQNEDAARRKQFETLVIESLEKLADRIEKIEAQAKRD
ncbi:MAG: hypothetical protein J5I93_20290 [Pirellulaceae bacterium]|nr:hypothetical protein [Pirellulaceae bacterium]